MRPYLRSRLVQGGLAMLILGTGRLPFITAVAVIGLWSDPNPNPIGPGMLVLLTFWLGLICLALGIVRVWPWRRGEAS